VSKYFRSLSFLFLSLSDKQKILELCTRKGYVDLFHKIMVIIFTIISHIYKEDFPVALIIKSGKSLCTNNSLNCQDTLLEIVPTIIKNMDDKSVEIQQTSTMFLQEAIGNGNSCIESNV